MYYNIEGYEPVPSTKSILLLVPAIGIQVEKITKLT